MQLDLDGLHALLSFYAGREGTVLINQRELAERLCASPYAVNRAIRALINQGRITALPGANGSASRTYEVMHPREWQARSGTPRSDRSADCAPTPE